jgi:hypothetical protein
MGIDLAVTTLWAELSTWSTSAAEVILLPQYWAVHGATRMGKAVTHDGRIEESAIDAACLEAGVSRAKDVMKLLARADRAAAVWTEPLPPRVRSSAEALAALEGEYVERVAPEGLELLLELAHALQAGALLAKDASFEDVRRVLATPPRTATKPSGAFSGLLAMSVDTLWVPTRLANAWDSPACVIASAVQLAEDLAALPACLRDIEPDAAEDLVTMGALIESLEEALALAGHDRCVVMRG